MAGTKKKLARAPVTRGVRVGGRSKRVVEAALRAAVNELARSGYTAFQIEEVAREAGVNRTSIYRRWPTKAKLLEAALREVSPFHNTQAMTGNLRRDLLDLSQRLVRWMRSAQGKTLMSLLTRDVRPPELVRLARTLGDESLAPWWALVESAKLRGEIARGIDARLLIQMILAPVTVRLERGERVNTKVLTTLIDVAVSGAAPGQRRTRAR
ncbi:MAG TPA: TetR/AcrR family transcriptional regulator [Polyangiales bacterium]|nr:TetR/AcrR family transcriptional regulator [Polyangiales bacterium]